MMLGRTVIFLTLYLALTSTSGSTDVERGVPHSQADLDHSSASITPTHATGDQQAEHRAETPSEDEDLELQKTQDHAKDPKRCCSWKYWCSCKSWLRVWTPTILLATTGGILWWYFQVYLPKQPLEPLESEIISKEHPLKFDGDFYTCHDVPEEMRNDFENRLCATLDYNAPEENQLLNFYSYPETALAMDEIPVCISGLEDGRTPAEVTTLQSEIMDAANTVANVIDKKFIQVECDQHPALEIEIADVDSIRKHYNGEIQDDICGKAPFMGDPTQHPASYRKVFIVPEAIEGKSPCSQQSFRPIVMHELAHKLGIQHTDKQMDDVFSSQGFHRAIPEELSVNDTNRLQANFATITKEDMDHRVAEWRAKHDTLTDEICDNFDMPDLCHRMKHEELANEPVVHEMAASLATTESVQEDR